MIQKRQEEYPDMPALNLVVVEPGQTVTIGSTPVKFFAVTHSIPDSMGISIQTPWGNVVATGDLKLDHNNGIPTDAEQKKWGELAKDNNLMFIADSTNAEKDGFSIPERKVHETLEEIVKTVSGRLIIGTFASQFERMIHIIETAEKLGKKVVLEGRSIKTNLEIAQKTNLLEIKKDTVIPAQEIGDYPPDKIVILATGAQGEEFAALMRIATKQHKNITLSARDTVVLSSSVIPGNVRANGVILTSDERFKTNVKAESGSDELNKFLNLKPVTYNWNELGQKQGGDPNELQHGFIAQEVEEQFPELVSTRVDGYKGVNYIGFIPVLVSMVQTLIETVSKMADEIVTKVVKTELLCVGSECLNEEQIRQIKNNSGVSGAPVVPTSTPTSAPSWTTDPATTTATTTEPTTSPIVEPSTTTEPIVETPTSEPETTPEPTPVEPVATTTGA
jgi:hypothetical protein